MSPEQFNYLEEFRKRVAQGESFKLLLGGHEVPIEFEGAVVKAVIERAESATEAPESPDEDAMRRQMYSTMGAVNAAALSITKFFAEHEVAEFVEEEERPESPDPRPSKALDQGRPINLRRAVVLLTRALRAEGPFPQRMTVTDILDQVDRLLGAKVCGECDGTGWLARDESCRDCQNGFLPV